MNTKNADYDLTALFAAEDETFDAVPFVNDVMAPIRRNRVGRRVILSFAALLGGIVAGAQVPRLMSGIDMTSDTVASTITALRGLGVMAQSANMVWITAIGASAVCAALVAMMERA